MRIGRFDTPIQIQEKTVTQNSIGDPVETWAKFADAWASVRYMTATERFQSDGLHSYQAINFRVRFVEGVLPTMRISFDSKYYRIVGISVLGRSEGLDITAEVYG